MMPPSVCSLQGAPGQLVWLIFQEPVLIPTKKLFQTSVYHLQYICNSVLFLKKFKSMHQRNAVFRVFSFNNLFLLLEKKYLHFLKPVLYHISSKKLVSYNNISILYSMSKFILYNSIFTVYQHLSADDWRSRGTFYFSISFFLFIIF